MLKLLQDYTEASVGVLFFFFCVMGILRGINGIRHYKTKLPLHLLQNKITASFITKQNYRFILMSNIFAFYFGHYKEIAHNDGVLDRHRLFVHA
jgi:hypothetical protein